MQRVLASVLLVWYAVLSIGFNLHMHYCCGELAEVAINQTTERCIGSCGVHHEAPLEKTTEHSCCEHKQNQPEEQNTNTCHIEKHCCSSDDIYVALEDQHQKPDFDLLSSAVALSIEQAHVYFADADNHARVLTPGVPIHGPPLYELYQQRLHYL